MSPPRPRPTARDELIAIALELLDDQHLEDLSLREVARRAGLSSGAPAHHFGNKLGLLAACAEEAWAELCTRIERAAQDGSEAEADLRQKARVYVDYALDHPGPYRLIASRLFDDGERFVEISQWRSRAMEHMVDRIPRPPEDPGLPWRRGFAVWALLHGYVTLVLDGAVSDTKLVVLTEEICDMAAVIGLMAR